MYPLFHRGGLIEKISLIEMYSTLRIFAGKSSSGGFIHAICFLFLQKMIVTGFQQVQLSKDYGLRGSSQSCGLTDNVSSIISPGARWSVYEKFMFASTGINDFDGF